MFRRFIETATYVQAFAVEESVTLLSDKCMQIFDGATRAPAAKVQLFEKDGLARSFILDDTHIYCTDFTELVVLDKRSLEVLARQQLGTDLSSDICARVVDRTHVYLSIRNGPVVRIRKGAWNEVETFSLSTSSIWTMHHDGTRIYAGNVDGQLLVIDPASMRVERQIHAHRQNLKSLCIADDLIVTASQDKSLAFWDRDSLAQIKVKRNTHKKAFAIVGIWNESILTVSYSCGEIKVWDLATLQEKATLPIAGCLSGQTLLRQSHLYLSSRAINGIDILDLGVLMG